MKILEVPAIGLGGVAWGWGSLVTGRKVAEEEEAVQSSAPAQSQCTREDRSSEVPAGGKLCLHHTTTTGRLGCSNQPDSRLLLPPKMVSIGLVSAIKTNTKEHGTTPDSKKTRWNFERLSASQPTILGRPRLLGRDTACCLPPAFLRYRKSVWNKPSTFARMFWLVFWTRPKLCIWASNCLISSQEERHTGK